MDSHNPKLVLIDGNAIIHRAYHAIPRTFATRSGEQTNAVYGFTTTLIKVLEDLQPQYVACSFDLSGPTFRHEHYADYKATRVKADQDLYDQIPRVRQVVETMGIPIYEKEGFEADDCIGTIVERITQYKSRQGHGSNTDLSLGGTKQSNDECRMTNDEQYPKSEIPNSENDEAMKQWNNIEVFIVTGDKDLFQLIDGFVKVYNLKKGLSQTQIVDRAVIKEEWNLDPEDFIDLKALAGDSSDNIPGVPGIGPKTAADLIQRYDTLIKLYDAIAVRLETNAIISKSKFLISNKVPNPEFEHSQIETFIGNWKLETENHAEEIDKIAKELEIKPRVLTLLITYYPQALMSQHLATIHRDVPIDFQLEDCRYGSYDRDKLGDLFAELGFNSLLRRFGVLPEKEGRKSTDEQKSKDEQLQLL